MCVFTSKPPNATKRKKENSQLCHKKEKIRNLDTDTNAKIRNLDTDTNAKIRNYDIRKYAG